MKFTKKEVAAFAHQVNKLYCEMLGDFSQVDWDDAPDWQRDSILAGVDAILSGQILSPGESHTKWLSRKLAEGWRYGLKKDVGAKEHPCMLAYEDLPPEQQLKDSIFLGIVNEFAAAFFDEDDYDGS